MNTLCTIPPEKKTSKEAPLELVLMSSKQDWNFVSGWKQKVNSMSEQSLKDSLEYAKLGAKRWSWLSSQKLCVGSIEELRERIASNPTEELGLALSIVRRNEPTMPDVLGFCYARRLWLNHLQLEFLAAMEGGIGTLLLYGLSSVAREVGAPQLWGECTQLSQGFYRKVKARLLTAHLTMEMEKKKGEPSTYIEEMQLPGAVQDRFSFGKVELNLMADLLEGMSEA
jgi:hypothetical protein